MAPAGGARRPCLLVVMGVQPISREGVAQQEVAMTPQIAGIVKATVLALSVRQGTVFMEARLWRICAGREWDGQASGG